MCFVVICIFYIEKCVINDLVIGCVFVGEVEYIFCFGFCGDLNYMFLIVFSGFIEEGFVKICKCCIGEFLFERVISVRCGF